MAKQYSEDEMKQMVMNVSQLQQLIDRRRLGTLAGEQYEGDRDVYKILGYKDVLHYEDYYGQWKREGLGKVIIRKPAETSWRKSPQIFSDDESDDWNTTLAGLRQRVRLDEKWKRVDTLAGIHRYAVLFLGFKETGTPDLSQPPQPSSGPDGLQYVKVFREDNVEDVKYNNDTNSPRYGMPEIYTIRMKDDQLKKIHWQRIIHVPSDLPEEDELLGTPRLEMVFNRLEDMLKVLGPSAEVFWSNADPGYKLLANDEGEVDWSSISDNFEAFNEKLIKFFRAQGVKEFEKMTGTPPDPSNIFDALVTYIGASAIPIAIPKRILLGSERGELASSQDAESWYGGIEERQNTHCTTYLVRPTIDRLMDLGILETRVYSVDWEPLFTLTAQDQAEYAKNLAQAIKAYNEARSLGGEIISEEEFRDAMGFPEREQPDMVENVKRALKK